MLLGTGFGCGGPPRQGGVSLKINPIQATVIQGQTQNFVVNAAGDGVRWSVLEGAAGGSVVDGVYQAPLHAGTFHVVATSTMIASDQAIATVSVPAVDVSITPRSLSMLAGTAMRFHATASNASDQSVLWSVAPALDGGSIDQGGLYTAGASEGAYSVLATSAAGDGPSAEASVTIVASLPGGSDLKQSDSPAARVIPTLRMYTVWWGDPAGFPPDAESSVGALLSALPGSRHLAIVNQYLLGSQADVSFIGNLHDPAHAPSTVNPSQNEVSAEICDILTREGITPTENDIYFVYPSTPVNPDPSGVTYCGWHSDGTCNGNKFLMAWVGTPAGTGGLCGNPVLAMDCAGKTAGASLVTRTSLHELFETLTNGVYPTWVDAQGEEMADKCGPYAVCIPIGSNTFVLEPEYSNEQHGCVAIRF